MRLIKIMMDAVGSCLGYAAGKGMFQAFSARALLQLVWMNYLTTRYTFPCIDQLHNTSMPERLPCSCAHACEANAGACDEGCHSQGCALFKRGTTNHVPCRPASKQLCRCVGCPRWLL